MSDLVPTPRPISPDRLRGFFAPRRYAVVGASESSNWARNIFRSLETVGAGDRVVPVHPRHDVVFGRAAARSLAALAQPADLAFVLAGPDSVEDIVRESAAAGVRNLIVLASGYGESGAGATGRDRQDKLARLAAELDVALLGPNTIGFLNPAAGAAPWAVGLPQPLRAGPVGAVFESGSMSRAGLEFAQAHAVGCSLWVSVGNSAVITAIDVFEHLVEDPATRSIALFLETIRDSSRFIELCARAAEAGKPVVVLKAGRTPEGVRAAAAHTGAMATDDAVVGAALRECGAVRVRSLEELVVTSGLFGYTTRYPAGRRMGVVTSSGGGCNVIADRAADVGLRLPDYAPASVERFREVLPPFSSINNPLDVTGFGHAHERSRPTKVEDDLLELAVDDPGFDFFFSMMTPLPAQPPAARTDIEDRLKIVGEIVAGAPRPVLLCSNTCLDLATYPADLLESNGLHLMAGLDLAMTAMGHLLDWVERREVCRRRLAVRLTQRAGVPAVSAEATGLWDEFAAREFLATHKVPLIEARLARSVEEAVAAATEFDGPVALKICSPDIAHKSDVGGVRLGITGADEIASAYAQLCAAVIAAQPSARVQGVLISPMRPPELELIVGATLDPIFGPVLTVGSGGVWTEALRDSRIALLPTTAEEVKELWLSLAIAPLLTGGRQRDKADLDAVVAATMAVADAALELGDRLVAVEVNPLGVTSGDTARVEALDALIETRA